MSNAKRPALTKAANKSEKERKAALDQDYTVVIDGKPYTIVPADLTGLLEMRIRRDTGYSVAEIVTRLEEAPGVDLLGCFMYACDLVAGKPADLEEILGSVSYATELDVVGVGDVNDKEADPVPQP